MATVANLTEEQATELEGLFAKFKQTNPDVMFGMFTQPRILSQGTAIEAEPKHGLEDKIDALNRKLDLIFGGHVMVAGKMVDMNALTGANLPKP